MRYLLCVVFLVFSISTFGQLNRGSKYINGGLSFYHRKNPETTNIYNSQTSVSIFPSFGFIVKENLAVGFMLGCNYSYSNYRNDKDAYNQESKMMQGNVGAFAKKYFKVADKFYFSLNSQFLYSRRFDNTLSTTAGVTARGESKGNVIDVSVGPGLTFFPTSKWALEGSIGSLAYLIRHSSTGGVTSHDINANFGTISISITRFFNE
jgi:hypothetical protein